MLARSSLLTARAALRQAPANPAMRRGLHVDSEFLVASSLEPLTPSEYLLTCSYYSLDVINNTTPFGTPP